eukprot:1162089-Pelagomonas_calceolata.AAC.4
MYIESNISTRWATLGQGELHRTGCLRLRQGASKSKREDSTKMLPLILAPTLLMACAPIGACGDLFGTHKCAVPLCKSCRHVVW